MRSLKVIALLAALFAIYACSSDQDDNITISIYMIEYDANGGEFGGGNTEAGAEYFPLGDIPQRSGSVFIEWNSLASGLGISYINGQYPADGSTVYAKWNIISNCTDTCILKFHQSYGDKVSPDVTASYGTTVQLPSGLNVSGRTLQGWREWLCSNSA